MFACLLTSVLCVLVSLSRSRLCHALCPLWACACVVAFVLPRVCLDVTTFEIHIHGVVVLGIDLSLLRVMLICSPCLPCATRLAFFASMLSCCTLTYMSMHEFVCRPYFNPMELWTLHPNLHLSSLDTPFIR